MKREPEQFSAASIEEWRAWLQAHHARHDGVWLVQWKPRTGKLAIPYEEAVEEALCHGWIDSTYRSLDEDRGMLWYSPRRKGSLWARSNKERVARLDAQGRMTAAGRAAVEQAKADGSWTSSTRSRTSSSRTTWRGPSRRAQAPERTGMTFPPTAKRAFLLRIATAKRAQTRRQRVEKSADLVHSGRRLDERSA